MVDTHFNTKERTQKKVNTQQRSERHRFFYCDNSIEMGIDHSPSPKRRRITTSHPCLICKHKFQHASDLKRHMRVHSGVKPFTCSLCSRSFSRKSNCKRHEKTHVFSRCKEEKMKSVDDVLQRLRKQQELEKQRHQKQIEPERNISRDVHQHRQLMGSDSTPSSPTLSCQVSRRPTQLKRSTNTDYLSSAFPHLTDVEVFNLHLSKAWTKADDITTPRFLLQNSALGCILPSKVTEPDREISSPFILI